MQFCRFKKAGQLEQFIGPKEDRQTDKIIRQSIACPKKEKTSLDVSTLFGLLHQQEYCIAGICYKTPFIKGFSCNVVSIPFVIAV
jgi:hypothetical protein